MSDICINEMVREVVKTEVDKYLKELGFPVKEEKVGFEDDEIFLLSTEEHKKYKNIIPKINCWWWLRSPGNNSYLASQVSIDGFVFNYGSTVSCSNVAVRPVLKISDYEALNLRLEERFVKYDFPWIYLGDNLAIAEVPISFGKFDDKSNDYKNSYVRRSLKQWVEMRK